MAADDLLQRTLEPSVRLDSIHLARLQQRRDTTPRGGALVMAGEQRVLRGELHRPDPILQEVRVHLDAPVVQEHEQPVPLVGDVGQLLAQARARRACPRSRRRTIPRPARGGWRRIATDQWYLTESETITLLFPRVRRERKTGPIAAAIDLSLYFLIRDWTKGTGEQLLWIRNR